MEHKYIYGPVPSRRLGFSLGVDIIPYKNCSFDCIYCQLGKTTNKTIVRKEYSPTEEILKEINERSKNVKDVDFITFSGSGEPTLHAKLGHLIKELKKITKLPIAVLTNSSLLFMTKVRKELSNANIVLPTLCTANQETFQKIHRPYPEITIRKTIDALVEFKKIYKGKVWLEIMLVDGFNNAIPEIAMLKDAIRRMNPDRVQLNTVVRPPSEKYASPISAEELRKIRDMIGQKCEIIADFKGKKEAPIIANNKKTILDTIRRRPVSINDISNITGLHEIEIMKYLEALQKEKKIKLNEHNGTNYYEIIPQEQK